MEKLAAEAGRKGRARLRLPRRAASGRCRVRVEAPRRGHGREDDDEGFGDPAARAARLLPRCARTREIRTVDAVRLCAAMRSGGTSRSGCWTATCRRRRATREKTGVGRVSRYLSRRPLPIRSLCAWIARMARASPCASVGRRPQGSDQGLRPGAGDRQHPGLAVGRDAGQGRALIPAGRQAPLRRSWNERMRSDGELVDPSPTVDQAVNVASLCSKSGARGADTSDVDLAAMTHPPTTFVHDLAGRSVAVMCKAGGVRGYLCYSWPRATPSSNRTLNDVSCGRPLIPAALMALFSVAAGREGE